jgi:hypothetical protein
MALRKPWALRPRGKPVARTISANHLVKLTGVKGSPFAVRRMVSSALEASKISFRDHSSAGFRLAGGQNPVFELLRFQANCISAPQAGEEQERKCQSFL